MLKQTEAFSGFSVDAVPRAKEFYGETLGLDVENQGDGFALHLAGGANVFVYPKGEAHEPASFTILNFQVDDVESTVAALKERGVEFERYPGTAAETDGDGIFRGEGPLIAWFKDPAGNVLSVIKPD
jgi:catechol 2,3-dioxygenase-like lactoylglutathione lyase family enzyme